MSNELEKYLPAGTPDWDAVDFSVVCSRCGYELRMLEQPRCPECGLAFDWRILFDATLSGGSTLFEHQWNRRPFRSFFSTSARTFNFVRFWRRLSIHVEPNATGLWLLNLLSCVGFWIVPIALICVVLLVTLLIEWIDPAQVAGLARYPTRAAKTPINAIQLTLLWELPSNPWSFAAWTRSFFTVACFPTAYAGLILGLRQTLSRCRVRAVQILRVITYCILPYMILQGVVFGINSFVIALSQFRILWFERFAILPYLIPGVFLIINVAYALRVYLQLPRSRIVAMVCGFVAALATLTIYIVLSIEVLDYFPRFLY